MLEIRSLDKTMKEKNSIVMVADSKSAIHFTPLHMLAFFFTAASKHINSCPKKARKATF